MDELEDDFKVAQSVRRTLGHQLLRGLLLLARLIPNADVHTRFNAIGLADPTGLAGHRRSLV